MKYYRPEYGETASDATAFRDILGVGGVSDAMAEAAIDTYLRGAGSVNRYWMRQALKAALAQRGEGQP